jgi:hypothetical protein
LASVTWSGFRHAPDCIPLTVNLTVDALAFGHGQPVPVKSLLDRVKAILHATELAFFMGRNPAGRAGSLELLPYVGLGAAVILNTAGQVGIIGRVAAMRCTAARSCRSPADALAFIFGQAASVKALFDTVETVFQGTELAFFTG